MRIISVYFSRFFVQFRVSQIVSSTQSQSRVFFLSLSHFFCPSIYKRRFSLSLLCHFFCFSISLLSLFCFSIFLLLLFCYSFFPREIRPKLTSGNTNSIQTQFQMTVKKVQKVDSHFKHFDFYELQKNELFMKGSNCDGMCKLDNPH